MIESEYMELREWLESNGFIFVGSEIEEKYDSIFEYKNNDYKTQVRTYAAYGKDLVISAFVRDIITSDSVALNAVHSNKINFEELKKFVFEHNKELNRDNIINELIDG